MSIRVKNQGDVQHLQKEMKHFIYPTVTMETITDGKKWTRIASIEGTLTKKALNSLKFEYWMKVICTFGLALRFPSVQAMKQSIKTGHQIKQVFIHSNQNVKIHDIAKILTPENAAGDKNKKRDDFETQFKKDGVRLGSQREVVKKALEVHADIWEFVSPTLQEDNELIALYLERHPARFDQMPDSLRADKAFIKQILADNPEAFYGIAPALRDDPIFLRELFDENLFTPRLLEDNYSKFLNLNDLDDVLKAVKIDGNFLMKLSPELIKDHKEIAIAALQTTPTKELMKFIPLDHPDYKEIAIAAISNNILLHGLERNADLYQNPVYAEAAEDPKVYRAYLIGGGPILQYEEYILECVNKDGLLLEHAPKFQDSETVVKAAIAENPEAIKFASKRLQELYKTS